MHKTTTAIAAVTFAASFLLAGCDVEKTKEGNVTMPKYEVQKTQEGNVTLPKYDVTAPSVVVGTTEKQVEVPKMTTETKTITVPVIGVQTADEKKAEKKAEGK